MTENGSKGFCVGRYRQTVMSCVQIPGGHDRPTIQHATNTSASNVTDEFLITDTRTENAEAYVCANLCTFYSTKLIMYCVYKKQHPVN